MRMAMISGPPAIPNFKGTGIPGMANGREPKIIPTIMPTKIVAMLGASRRFTELPIISATRFTFSSGPTTKILSPTWKWWFLPAKMSIPWREIRVTLTPYTLEKCILPKVLPFISGRVTTIRRETKCCTSSLSRSHSASTSGPIKALMASASASAHTTSNSSPTSNLVLLLGMLTSPLWSSREHTMSRFKNSETSLSVLPVI